MARGRVDGKQGSTSERCVCQNNATHRAAGAHCCSATAARLHALPVRPHPSETRARTAWACAEHATSHARTARRVLRVPSPQGHAVALVRLSGCAGVLSCDARLHCGSRALQGVRLGRRVQRGDRQGAGCRCEDRGWRAGVSISGPAHAHAYAAVQLAAPTTSHLLRARASAARTW